MIPISYLCLPFLCLCSALSLSDESSTQSRALKTFQNLSGFFREKAVFPSSGLYVVTTVFANIEFIFSDVTTLVILERFRSRVAILNTCIANHVMHSTCIIAGEIYSTCVLIALLVYTAMLDIVKSR